MSSRKTPIKKCDIGFYLSVISRLENENPAKVASSLEMKQQTLNYHLRKLKVLDVVEKIGYGTWKVKKENLPRLYASFQAGWKEVKKSYPIRSRMSGGVAPQEIFTSSADVRPNTVRTHALQFVVNVPPMARWRQTTRRKFLESRNIKFERIQQGERLFVLDARVWLTNKSIVVWLPWHWFVDTADEGYLYGVYELKRVIRKTESLLNIDLKIKGSYRFRPARQHHALVKNELAKQYNKEKKKFYCFDQKGLWLLIDNSEGEAELEGVANRGRDGQESRDVHAWAQQFWNEARDLRISPKELMSQIQETYSAMAMLNETIRSHTRISVDTAKRVKEIEEEIFK